MQLNLTGRHVDITPSIRDYVNLRFDRIERHFDHITNVNVVLSVEKKFQQKAEARINVAGNGSEIFAHSEQDDMYAAIDLLVDKLDRQIIRHKEKLQDRHVDSELNGSSQ